ncbi:MAG: flavodoxin family protein, partial [Clostridiaceae bacterium]
MKKIILCPKSSGNTYEVCKYVSDNSNFKLKTINENTKINLQDYDTVILASGIYANHVHKNISRWINNIENDKKSNIKTALFLTWLGRGASDKVAYDEIKELLKNKNI